MKFWASIDFVYCMDMAIDFVHCMDMALLNVNEECFFHQNVYIFIFFY